MDNTQKVSAGPSHSFNHFPPISLRAPWGQRPGPACSLLCPSAGHRVWTVCVGLNWCLFVCLGRCKTSFLLCLFWSDLCQVNAFPGIWNLSLSDLRDPDDGLKWPVAFYDRNGVGGAKWAKYFFPQMIVLSN